MLEDGDIERVGCNPSFLSSSALQSSMIGAELRSSRFEKLNMRLCVFERRKHAQQHRGERVEISRNFARVGALFA